MYLYPDAFVLYCFVIIVYHLVILLNLNWVLPF